MPRIIVLAGQAKRTVFDLFSETTVGSTDECDLVLDGAGVSRNHARLTIVGEDVRIQDLGSANGIRVGGDLVEDTVVSAGAEIGIGRYTLVPVADDQKFYKGRPIMYLPKHGGTGRTATQATTQLGAGEIEKMQQLRHVINGGRLVLDSDPESFWLPGAHKITFGGQGMVEVSGLFTGGIVAEVAWDGTAHVLRRLAKFATIKVNGSKTDEMQLGHGDQVVIGKTAMHYDLPEA